MVLVDGDPTEQIFATLGIRSVWKQGMEDSRGEADRR